MIRYLCRQYRNFVAGTVLSIMSVAAAAEAPRERVEIARQLVGLMDYRAMFETALAECRKSNAAYDPAEIFKTNAAAFGGITPRSAYWPEINAAYRRYQDRACKYLSSDDVATFLARQFAERISLEDLRASLAFYSSPAGRRIQAASLQVNAGFQAYMQENFNQVVARANKDMQTELTAVIAKYRRTPK